MCDEDLVQEERYRRVFKVFEALLLKPEGHPIATRFLPFFDCIRCRTILVGKRAKQELEEACSELRTSVF